MVSVVKYVGHNEACSEAFRYFMKDCKTNPGPFVEPTDIIMGKDWLTENGPNYVAYDASSQPLGFLAIGWKYSTEQMHNELLKDAKLLSNDGVPTVTIQECYNIFMYISSSARRKGVGETLLLAIPDILMHGDCRQLRYTSVINNEGSKSLITKVLQKTSGLVVDKYAHVIDNCDCVTYILSSEETVITRVVA